MNKPQVTVIIPTFNMAHYLGECISSVTRQSVGNMEVIVIDDGSTDNTNEIVSSFGNRVSYFYQSNRGESAARNMGIKISSGEYLAFLDADDIWLPEKIEKQIAVLNRNPNIGMVACGYTVVNETGRILYANAPRNYNNRETLRNALSIAQIIPGSASGVLIRRECFGRLGCFDEEIKIGPDWDMWLRISSSYEIYFIEETLVTIRRTSGKPEFRNPLKEEFYVGRVIEKNVKRSKKNRAYAALYHRLGQNELAAHRMKESMSYILRSLMRYPLPIYPKYMREREYFMRDSRMYILLKSVAFRMLNRK